jgi:hypothetical protein
VLLPSDTRRKHDTTITTGLTLLQIDESAPVLIFNGLLHKGHGNNGYYLLKDRYVTDRTSPEWRLLGCYAVWLLQEPSFSEELNASIIRVTRIGELGTLTVTSN